MKLPLNDPKKVTINARDVWNDTGIDVNAGETYSFRANGLWTDLIKSCDANGYTNAYMRLFDRWKRSRDNDWFALIGSLNQSGDFLIGTQKTIDFNTEGRLYCFANDVPHFYWNNRGSLTLEITRLK